MAFLDYKSTRPWAKAMKIAVLQRKMPPWFADRHYGEFANDRRLSQSEIDIINAWVDNGAPEGDPKDLPPAPTYVDGWSIGKPDLVLQMPEEFTLGAGGPDEYQYFEIPTKFTEDKYVQMAEARPGNRKIVHHIIAFIQPAADGKPQPKFTKEDIEKFRAQREKESFLGGEAGDAQPCCFARIHESAEVHMRGQVLLARRREEILGDGVSLIG